MATPPRLKRLFPEDFEGVGEPVRRALATLAPFTSDVTDALYGGLTFENMAALVHEFSVLMPDWWTAPTFYSPWDNYAAGTYLPTGFMKDAGGRVHLRGMVAGGVYGNPVFKLPVGFRPAYRSVHPVTQRNKGADHPGQVLVYPNGNVLPPDTFANQTAVTSQYLSLDGVSFESADPTPALPGEPFPLLVDVRSLPGRPANLWALSCRDITDRGTPAPLPVVTWEVATVSGNPVVKITNLQGLAPNRKYRVRVVVLAA